MALLTADQLIAALNEKPTLDFEIPGVGSVRIRTITGRERDRFESQMHFADGDAERRYADMRSKLVSLCVVDEKGERLFNDLDVARLTNGSAALLDLIYSACRKHNRMTPADQEELLKNSRAPTGANGASGTN